MVREGIAKLKHEGWRRVIRLKKGERECSSIKSLFKCLGWSRGGFLPGPAKSSDM